MKLPTASCEKCLFIMNVLSNSYRISFSHYTSSFLLAMSNKQVYSYAVVSLSSIENTYPGPSIIYVNVYTVYNLLSNMLSVFNLFYFFLSYFPALTNTKSKF